MIYAIDSMTQKQVFAQIVSTLIKILKIYTKSADYKKRVVVIEFITDDYLTRRRRKNC
jgi:hypothetical protein